MSEEVLHSWAKDAQELIDKLMEELERNTQEIDSYGEMGSNFRICTYCHAESGAGMLDKGIPHEADCILSNAKHIQPESTPQDHEQTTTL